MTCLTRLLPACAVLAGLATLAPALAAPTATITNADEPGRNPYQESLAIGFASELDFSPVPAGQRLVVTNLNCQGSLNPTSTKPVYVQAYIGKGGLTTLFIPMMSQRGESYAGNIQTTWFVEPGQNVLMVFSEYNSMFCTVSGYFVKL